VQVGRRGQQDVSAQEQPKGGYIFETPKSGKGRSVRRLTRKATAAFREHRKRQLAERMRKAGLWQGAGARLSLSRRHFLLGGNLNRAFKAALKRGCSRRAPAFTTCGTLAPRSCFSRA
jgi:hypothetical protein